MKVLLMHADRDFDLNRELPKHAAALTDDLELEILWREMAQGDRFLFEVARRAMLATLPDPGSIVYRQQVLADCLEQASVVRDIYALTLDAIRRERTEHFGIFSDSPNLILHRSVRVLEMFMEILHRLRDLADQHSDDFRSPGFRRFFAMVESELGEGYLEGLGRLLKELNFGSGVLMSAGLGTGLKGTRYTLRRQRDRGWLRRIALLDRSGLTFQIPDRDVAGARALSELEERGINHVANACAQAADHILDFFNALATELAFYIGCLNLHERLAATRASCVHTDRRTARGGIAGRARALRHLPCAHGRGARCRQ